MKSPPSIDLPRDRIPRHIGIIMDGNGRWAESRGLPRTEGHRRGADTFGKICKHCRKLGVQYVTAYAFSTENWKRPPDEVEAIMRLLRKYLEDIDSHKDEDARLCFFGDRTMLADDLRERIEIAERESAHNTAIYINIALNYGARDEIVRAARALAQACVEKTLTPAQIDVQAVSDHLYTAGMPDPDMIIRPSGEFRTSNFLLWQSAYSELIFMDVLWPDFTPKHLDLAIKEFLSRSRRFGGI